MLTFRVYRTSTFLSGHRPENELSYLEERERVDEKVAMSNWFIDFSTLEDLMSFISANGRVIIKPPTYKNTAGDIELYDCDREELFLDEIIN